MALFHPLEETFVVAGTRDRSPPAGVVTPHRRPPAAEHQGAVLKAIAAARAARLPGRRRQLLRFRLWHKPGHGLDLARTANA